MFFNFSLYLCVCVCVILFFFQILIFWKTPEEWADELWSWVDENGLNDTVCTAFELLQGDTGENSCKCRCHIHPSLSLLAEGKEGKESGWHFTITDNLIIRIL